MNLLATTRTPACSATPSTTDCYRPRRPSTSATGTARSSSRPEHRHQGGAGQMRGGGRQHGCRGQRPALCRYRPVMRARAGGVCQPPVATSAGATRHHRRTFRRSFVSSRRPARAACASRWRSASSFSFAWCCWTSVSIAIVCTVSSSNSTFGSLSSLGGHGTSVPTTDRPRIDHGSRSVPWASPSY